MKINKQDILDDYYNRINSNYNGIEEINNKIKNINLNEQVDFNIPLDIDITINGQKINKNDYYRDFNGKKTNMVSNNINRNFNNRLEKTNINENIVVNTGQVDPNDFFKNSLNDIIDKIKNN